MVETSFTDCINNAVKHIVVFNTYFNLRSCLSAYKNVKILFKSRNTCISVFPDVCTPVVAEGFELFESQIGYLTELAESVVDLSVMYNNPLVILCKLDIAFSCVVAVVDSFFKRGQ